MRETSFFIKRFKCPKGVKIKNKIENKINKYLNLYSQSIYRDNKCMLLINMVS
jgi:hypothetical protein